MPVPISLPTNIAVNPGKSPDQDALIEITALKNGVAVVRVLAQLQVPTNRVAQLLMVLAQDCEGQVTTCPSGQSCQPATGMCGSNVVSTPSLPTYPSPWDAGASPETEAGFDATTVVPDSGADVSVPDASPKPNCAPGGPGLTNCGVSQESCCTSLEVTGGTYYRTYTNDGTGPTDETDPAIVSSFNLDKYLVTVGRFRQFVNAWNAGWLPAPGSGKHTYLNNGNGLNATGGGYQPGWVATDDSFIAPTNANLACGNNTWTNAADSQENLPINCANWYEAYAFCTWDGGFLPSEAEWEYAAAGGSQKREYPWGPTGPGTSNQYAIYGCNYPAPNGVICSGLTGVANIAPVGTATLGAGLWGQLDMAGDLNEWNLDLLDLYADPCTDCADCTVLSDQSSRVFRGGFFGPVSVGQPASYLLLPPGRFSGPPSGHYFNVGFRCARSPLNCPTGQVNQNGDCAPCSSGETACGDLCVNEQTDPNNCGACGFACTGTTLFCTNGACASNPPSCAAGGPGMTNCGSGGSGTESCCTSLEVAGGTFWQTYVIDADGGPAGEQDPATVSTFRLDKYDVTVGRFRQVVAAWSDGYRPQAGAGKHTHLNGGRGLVNSVKMGAYEPGWLQLDEQYVTPDSLPTYMPNSTFTWTPTPQGHENLPVGGANWYEAYAFCIWNGGFLPSRAEWEYAASGGSEQRKYPWGSTDPGTMSQYAIFQCCYPTGSCNECAGAAVAPVGTPALGAGRWGQLDLVGNIPQWSMDADGAGDLPDPCTDCSGMLPEPCTDCSYLVNADPAQGAFAAAPVFGNDYSTPQLTPGGPFIYGSISALGDNSGFRCARTP